MRALIFAASLAVFLACGGQPPVVADGGSGGGSATGGGGGGATGGGSSSGGGGGSVTGGGAGGGSVTGGGTGGGAITGGGAGGGTADAGVVGPTGCVTDVGAGHHTFSCDSITYEVEIPTACASGGCGVVVDVHGATMTAAAEDKSTGLRATAGALGYVVVQPTAPLVFAYRSWTPGTDDPKVWAFLQQVVTALAINPKKLHFTGFSQGGAMTWRMLCAHADVLASVAPVAAADGQTLSALTPPFILDCPFTGAATPSQQVPILQMHGTADGLVPFSKAQQQRDAVIAAWSLGTPTTVTTDPKFVHTRSVSATGTTVEFLQHDYVAPGSLLLVNLGGHCLPGGQDLPPNGTPNANLYFSCVQPNGFTWGQQLMQFFVAHPRP